MSRSLLFLHTFQLLFLLAWADHDHDHHDHDDHDDHDHDSHHVYSLSTKRFSANDQEQSLDFAFLLLAIVTIAAIKIGFGLAPRYFRGDPRILSLANSFSAGVFLACGLAHLLPEAVHDFSSLHLLQDLLSPEKGAFICCGLGFLLTLLLEKVLMKRPPSKDEVDEEEMTLQGEDEKKHKLHVHSHSFDPELPLLPLILTVVLSFHSFVSGLALGVQSDAHKAFLLWLAIVLHKWVEAFSLGVSFVRAGTSLSSTLRFLCAFAASSLLGIVVGWTLHKSAPKSSTRVMTAILDGMASGTFVYIASVDLIVEEMSIPYNLTAKFLSIVGGFFTFVILSAHSH